MTGMTIGELLDKVFYGDEIEFQINDMTYFIQETFSNNKYRLTVDYWTITDGSEPLHDYLPELECDSAEERMRQFEEAKIFNGKTIFEAEPDIKVLFG